MRSSRLGPCVPSGKEPASHRSSGSTAVITRPSAISCPPCGQRPYFFAAELPGMTPGWHAHVFVGMFAGRTGHAHEDVGMPPGLYSP